MPTHSSRSWRSNFKTAPSQVTSVNSLGKVPVTPRSPNTPRVPAYTTEISQHIDSQHVELVDMKNALGDYDEKKAMAV